MLSWFVRFGCVMAVVGCVPWCGLMGAYMWLALFRAIIK